MAILRVIPCRDFPRGWIVKKQGARACSEIYQMAAESLLAYEDDLTRRDRRRLSKALGQVQHTYSQERRAWIMREALDAVYHGDIMPQLSAR